MGKKVKNQDNQNSKPDEEVVSDDNAVVGDGVVELNENEHENVLPFEIYYDEEENKMVFVMNLRVAWGDSIDDSIEEMFSLDATNELLNIVSSIRDLMLEKSKHGTGMNIGE